MQVLVLYYSILFVINVILWIILKKLKIILNINYYNNFNHFQFYKNQFIYINLINNSIP